MDREYGRVFDMSSDRAKRMRKCNRRLVGSDDSIFMVWNELTEGHIRMFRQGGKRVNDAHQFNWDPPSSPSINPQRRSDLHSTSNAMKSSRLCRSLKMCLVMNLLARGIVTNGLRPYESSERPRVSSLSLSILTPSRFSRRNGKRSGMGGSTADGYRQRLEEESSENIREREIETARIASGYLLLAITVEQGAPIS